MGGKTWSLEEEQFFWETIVPLSPSSAYITSRELTWEACAAKMQKDLPAPHRRHYTKSMLYEHYFQNMRLSTITQSPKARKFAEEHKRQLAAAEAERRAEEVRKKRQKGPVDFSHRKRLKADESDNDEPDTKRPRGPDDAAGLEPSHRPISSLPRPQLFNKEPNASYTGLFASKPTTLSSHKDNSLLERSPPQENGKAKSQINVEVLDNPVQPYPKGGSKPSGKTACPLDTSLCAAQEASVTTGTTTPTTQEEHSGSVSPASAGTKKSTPEPDN